MVKLVVFNQKGGVGKTSASVNIAACLACDFKKKVLLVDCDSQMNATNYLMTQQDDEAKRRTIVDIIKKKRVWPDDIVKISFVARGKMRETRLSLIPASPEITFLGVKDISILINVFKELDGAYDYVIFDCPPQINDLSVAALAYGDYVIVPARPDTDSLGGYDLLMDTVNSIRSSGVNISLKILGIFFNAYDNRHALERYIVEDCRDNMGDMVFKSCIRSSTAVEQGRYYGRPLTYYKHSSPVTKDYIKLTKEIIEKTRE